MNINPKQWLTIVTQKSSELEIIELLKKNEPIPYSMKLTKGFNPGTFGLQTIGNLRVLSQEYPDENIPCPTFTLYVRSPDNLKGKVEACHRFFDTSALQLHLPFLGKTKYPILYQVASNFNCQENGSAYVSVTSNTYLTNMMTDSTQGPSAAAGAGLGAIERLRFHIQTPINLLSAFSKNDDNKNFIEVQNGKLTNWSNELDVLQLDIDQVQIGIHQGLSANFDRSDRKRCVYYENGQPINQVFVSTICLPDKAKNYKKNSKELELASILLKAAYDGTYLTAASLESRQLVLTFIGGGAFNNPFELIIEALAKAHMNIRAPLLEEVILPIWDPMKNYEEIVKLLEINGLPKEKIRVVFH